MRFVATSLLALCLAAAGLHAQGPTFDCAKADGDVETLICKDPALGALDRKLDEIYKAATAKARDKMAATLRAEQRGWVKGRNECWKAQNVPTFLTASWTASTVRECVEANYRIRTSELQAVWQLAPAKKPVSYVCQNNPANEVVATYFDTDSAHRARRTRRPTSRSAGHRGQRRQVEGQNVTFWNKGSEATVTWLNTNTGVTEDLQCRAR